MTFDSNKQFKILVSTGETSGDEHATKLLAELSNLNLAFSAFGMCGRHLEKQGVEKVVDAELIGSVMGFGEVFSKILSIRSALKTLESLIRTRKPDAVLIVDFPDFNMRLAKIAHAAKIPVFYFIPPKIWAWRSSRARQLQQHVSRAAFIFPHEEAIATKLGFTKGKFVGHPYCTDPSMRIGSAEERRSIRQQLGIDVHSKLLVLSPGSRKGEIRRHLKALRDATTKILSLHPDVTIAISQAPGISIDDLEPIRNQGDARIKIIDGSQQQLFKIADAGLIKSGTSNLQAAFYGFPFSMFFKAPWITSKIVKTFVSLKEFSLVNIIAPSTIREILQEDVCGDVLAKEAEALLYDETYRTETTNRLASMRERLSTSTHTHQKSAYQTAAELFIATLNTSPS